MQPKLLKSARWAFIPLVLLLAQQSRSQCLFTSPFGSATINTAGAVVTISTCSFAGEYSTISGAVSGQTLQFTSQAGDFITIRSGTSSGPVVAFGTTPLTFANTFTGTLYAHWALNAACATQSTCRTTTVQCTSCSPPPAAPNDLCTGAINIACGQTISGTTTGQGIDAVPTCGTSFGTAAGVWYSFTGDGQTVTLSLCGSAYDTKIGAFSGSCAALTCVAGNDDFCGLQSQISFPTTNGVNYFILVTGFSTGSGAFTLVRTCVPVPVTPPCLVSPSSPTNGQSAICPSANQTLSWPVSTGATSYDVYFGTSNPPPFVANTLATSYVATTPTSGQYFWQIRPRGPGGVASGCSVWNFTKSDLIPPSITCPANVVRNNDAGKCGAVVAYPTPTATDNCGVQSIVQQSGVASGALHPVGVTINVWKASDFAGNMATCSFTVTVTDVEKPVATCPPDRSVNNDPGKCSALLNINGGLGLVDNCGISSTSNNAPSPFPVGETIVTWTARDPSNNSGTCSFKVTVIDAEFPVVHCPANINTLTDLGDCAARVNFNVSASDNCGVGSTNLSDASGSSFPLGWTNIDYSATDVHGNVSTCAFQIIVNTRPEICNEIDDDCDGWVDEAEDWLALVKRFASDAAAAEEYGISVDIDGDYAIVGSNQKNGTGQNVGSAYLLFRDKSGTNKWGQVIELINPAAAPGDNFGASVAISGGVAAVGAPLFDDQFGNQGVVFIFHQNASNPEQWDFVKILQTNDPASADNFGASVALDGDRLLAGSPLNDQSSTNAGAAYVFYRNLGGANNWGQAAKMLATTGAADDNMGISVAIDGDYAIVGANGVDGFLQNAGAAYIFGRNQFGPDAWGQVAKIRANQTGQNDNFGASVGISGSWAIVGADRNDLKGADAGAAFLFHKNHNGISNSWGQRQILLDFNGQAGDRFGSAVGIDEPYAVVTAKGDSPFGAGSGRGFVYLLDGSAWILVDQLTDGGGQADDALGSAAAISGRNIILGEPLDNNGSNNEQGAVIVYGGLCDDELNQDGDNRDDFNVNSESSVRCFPVPFSDVLNIEVKGMKSVDATVAIINSMGQVVAELYKGTIEGDMLFQWQPTQSADGLYFLRMVTGEKVMTQTIVRTR